MTIEVMRPGTPVRVGLDRGTDRAIRAEVTAVTIRGRGETWLYEVTWWDGRSRSVAWFEPWEVEPAEARPPLRVGF